MSSQATQSLQTQLTTNRDGLAAICDRVTNDEAVFTELVVMVSARDPFLTFGALAARDPALASALLSAAIAALANASTAKIVGAELARRSAMN